MGVLLWLMIPVAFLIAGTIYASIRSRPRRPTAMQDSMASFSRFRRALAASTANSPAKHLTHPGDAHADDGPDPSKRDEPASSLGRPE